MDVSTNMFDLSGKTALITGARTGLGRAAAEALAAAGCDVIGLGSTSMPDTQKAVEALGRRFTQLVCDLNQDQDFEALLEGFSIDVLVNNAGQIRRENLLEFSDTDWDDVLQINLKSGFKLSQAVARKMVKEQCPGRIINIASLLAFQGGIRVASYTAAKHGLLGLTRAMSNELAPMGITVNAIAPGYIETDNTKDLIQDPKRYAEILGRIPAGRWGKPEDICSAVLFLSSPLSSFVTGSCISVDGGWMAR